MGPSRRLDLLNFVNENQDQQRKLISLTNYSRIVISWTWKTDWCK